jgi:hypothetical protein
MSSTHIRRILLAGAGTIAVIASVALVVRTRLPVRNDPSDADIALVSIFAGTALRPTSQEFRGGSIVSLFGGTQLDLRRTEVAHGQAILRVTTVFGGTDITVPDGWNVHITGPRVFGGVRHLDEIRPADPDGPSLQIEAKTLFGGLQVMNRPVLRAADAS